MIRREKRRFLFLLTLAAAMILAAGCKNHKNAGENSGGDSIAETDETAILKDTLKVVTLYGPTSFFDYRGELMGIDYENAKRFARDEGLALDIKALDNLQQLISALESGEADLAAYPVPIIAEYKDKVIYCGKKEISTQVLVQRKGESLITDVTQLPGKDIYVEKDSKYHYRLDNLNEELGGGLNIKPIKNDTIAEEDFLEMVDKGKIDYTVVDSEIASVFGKGLPNLDFSLKISAEQAGSWAVGRKHKALAEKIDKWENLTHTTEMVKEIYKGYYDSATTEPFDVNLSYFKERNLAKGAPVSDYDSYFKKYASTAGYDWRLLAAIAYCESRYNTNIASRFGAYGLMQVMPNSARSVGVDAGSLGSPDSNVLAASKIIQKLDNSLKERVEDPEERLKFVVAAYNSGLGHVNDAIALANKLGLDPQKWTGSVSVTALMKSRPEYYNDPVVKNGYFRGRETVNFVDNVTAIYRYLKENIPNKP